ncbi:MAG: hypothetical protein IIB39_05280 [Candidatus Marinimicrobia bacterium]|nr:hypothetical protein [Candidatus Neomarinimicrobiota bacterium]
MAKIKRVSPKHLFVFSLIGTLFIGCDMFQNPPLMTFEAHIFYSEIDHRAVKDWGENIDVSIEFQDNRFVTPDGDEIRSINLTKKENLKDSAIFRGELFGEVNSEDYRDISYSWVINNIRTKHIFKRKSSISKGDSPKKSLLLDVTKVIFAEHIWNKSNNSIEHNIMITNQSSYLLDSLDFSIGYYSKNDIKLDHKNRVYRNSISRNRTKRITFSVRKIKGLNKVSSASPHLSAIYYNEILN